MYKVGDLVRVIKTGDIYNVMGIGSNTGRKLYLYISGLGKYEEEIEPVTHLTTKEFIKLVEDMGYELDIRTGVIFIKTKNFREVGWVRTDYEYSAAFNFECDKLLLDIFYLYANTPLELREEKEKLYTLELPGNICESDKYYNAKEGKYFFGMKDNRLTTYKTQFTQKEIDELPNQELIKTLIKKEVKENENE